MDEKGKVSIERCPLCGSSAVSVTDHVMCVNPSCGICGPTRLSEQAVIDSWNRMVRFIQTGRKIWDRVEKDRNLFDKKSYPSWWSTVKTRHFAAVIELVKSGMNDDQIVEEMGGAVSKSSVYRWRKEYFGPLGR